MIKTAIITILILLSGCSSISQDTSTFEVDKKLLVNSKSNSEFYIYVSEFLASQNSQRLDDKSGCYKINPKEQVEIILTVNETGLITKTSTVNSSDKSTCFKNAYLGAKMPKPPFSPIAIELLMM